MEERRRDLRAHLRQGSAKPELGRLARPFWLAVCFIPMPLGASFAQTSDLAVQYSDATDLSSATTDQDAFDAQFADLIAPRDSNVADVDLALPETAVDLGTFEPPLEIDTRPTVVRDLGTGVASYYGRRFHGRRTANGERFDMNAMTAAHKTLPFGTRVLVTNPSNGRSVTVRINDRGPFIRGRTIDLSRAAAEQIGMIARGHARVKLDVVSR